MMAQLLLTQVGLSGNEQPPPKNRNGTEVLNAIFKSIEKNKYSFIISRTLFAGRLPTALRQRGPPQSKYWGLKQSAPNSKPTRADRV
jgi:hypothetical protein